jgi:hypothetical protein
MPYNFEATFVQPLLLQLDNGVIKGADSWADAITKAYITTIKAGLPQGTPPVLPAPGLNPTTPPPYPLGVSGFTTADSRSQAFYTIIRAYFLAKEVSLDKGAIESFVQSVKQLIQKLKVRTAKVKSLLERIKQIQQQLSELPKLITEIIAGVKEEVKNLIEEVKGIFSSVFDEVQTSMGPADFVNVFREEINLFESLKKFDPTNVAGIRDIVLFVSEYGKRTNNLLASGTSEQLLKKYFRDRVFGIAKTFIDFANGIIDPSKILDLMSQLASKLPRLQKLYNQIKRFDLIVRFVEPQLKKLKKRKDDLIKQIREVIQPKIVELQKKLAQKQAELVKKLKDSKAASLYASAAKKINDLKKKNEKKVKKSRTKVQQLTKAYKQSRDIIGRVTTLIEGVKLEFTSIGDEIKAMQKSVEQTFNQNASFDAIDTIQPGPGPLSVNDIKTELIKMRGYVDSLGLGEFGEVAALVITQTKCNFETFKLFFEKRNMKIKQYVLEIEMLEFSIRGLINTIQEIRSGKKRAKENKSIASKWLLDRVKSMKDLLNQLVVKIRPLVRRVSKFIKDQIKKVKDFIKNDLKKFQEDLKVFAINLIPIKSDVQDAKDKKAAAEDKMRKIRDKMNQLKKLIELGKYTSDTVRGLANLVSNVAAGNYKFSENLNHINRLLDGIYNIRGFNKSDAVKSSLQKEKQRARDQFKMLLVIEALVVGIVETVKEIKETDFKKELQEIVDNLSSNYPGKQTLQTIVNLADNPPKNINEIKSVLDQLATGALMDASVINNLVSLERKYLRKSRELVKVLCDVKKLEGTAAEKKLLKIKNYLDKDQSFLSIAFDMLSDELKNFQKFIAKKAKKLIDSVKQKIAVKRAKVEALAEIELKKIIEKKVNPDAVIMSITFGLAARLFWTGATWTGPTGTNHITLNIGIFKQIKAKSTEGASAMIRQMAKSFELQLTAMSGLVIPPANTGIPPVAFSGYK